MRRWDHATFTQNRDRLLKGGAPEVWFNQGLDGARAEHWLSDEPCSVEGTMIRAWAAQASFVHKEGRDDDGSNFRGEKRSNDTHASTTDAEARLFKKSPGSEAHWAYLGHALTENRHGFAGGATLTHATGKAEREAALTMRGAAAKGPAPARVAAPLMHARLDMRATQLARPKGRGPSRYRPGPRQGRRCAARWGGGGIG